MEYSSCCCATLTRIVTYGRCATARAPRADGGGFVSRLGVFQGLLNAHKRSVRDRPSSSEKDSARGLFVHLSSRSSAAVTRQQARSWTGQCESLSRCASGLAESEICLYPEGTGPSMFPISRRMQRLLNQLQPRPFALRLVRAENGKLEPEQHANEVAKKTRARCQGDHVQDWVLRGHW